MSKYLDDKRLDMFREEDGSLLVTESQAQAILQDGHILVSASAGSGKTSTMIKKIIHLIANGKSLKDMLIVVYNESAAAELKEKLHEALFKMASKKGLSIDEKKKYRKELDEMEFASIGTIHAFCSSLIRENFEKVGVSPRFTVLDEEEHNVYMDKALNNVFDKYSEEKDELFADLGEIFLQQRKEDNIKANIIKLYKRMDIQPNKDVIVNTIHNCYDSFENSEFLKVLANYYKNVLIRAQVVLQNVYETLTKTVQKKYETKVFTYIDICKSIAGKDDIFAMIEEKKHREEDIAMSASIIKKDGGENDVDLVEYCKDVINNTKAIFNELASIGDMKDKLENMHEQNAKYVFKMLEITQAFDAELEKLKKEDDALSFNDLLHKVVELLDNYSEDIEKFDMVFVDEYQDVNPTQEYIIEHLLKDNSFMVGDIKQSIYGFNLADPTIFLARQNRYEKGEGIPIYFNRNFRSTKNILSAVNDIYSIIMTAKSADVDYKGTSKFELDDVESGGAVELHLFPKKQDNLKEFADGIYDITTHKKVEAAETGAHREGKWIASKIRELVGHVKVDGKADSAYIKYSDIAILFRARGASAERIIEVLKNEGIPLDESYFATEESNPEKDLISFLRVIDNPRQDIPFAGYLLSFFGGYNETELAKIALESGPCFYDKFLNYSLRDDALADKAKKTIKDLDTYITKASFKSVSDLMGGIVTDYSYEAYLMHNGAGDVYGLKAFISNVQAYDYQSLGEFLEDYISDSKSTSGVGGADAVVLSSFHKFKGLEIPVTFVADLDYDFSSNDYKGDMYTYGKGYVGLSFFNLEDKTKEDSISKMAVKSMILENQLKEEMRLMYVALTRAKRYLYMSANLSQSTYDRSLFGEDVKPIKSCFDLLIQAKYEGGCDLLTFVHDDEITPSILPSDDEKTFDKDMVERIRNSQKDEYKYSVATKLAMKFGVSSVISKDDVDARVYEDKADLGTIYHKVMEHIDYYASSIEDVEKEFDRFVSEDIMPREDLDKVDKNAILNCLNSSVMQIARKYESKLRCHREQKFMMYKPAKDLSSDAEFDTDDRVLVQGVVDLFIDGDDGEKIIVDFKHSNLTDPKQRQKYKRQLNLYKMAIEGKHGIKVDKTILYSFITCDEINTEEI